jgi:hypothetical protein
MIHGLMGNANNTSIYFAMKEFKVKFEEERLQMGEVGQYGLLLHSPILQNKKANRERQFPLQ